MDFTIKVQISADPLLSAALADLIERTKRMDTTLQTLTDQVRTNNNLVQSAVTLIGGLAQKIEDLKDDPAALQALADELRTSDDMLAAAIQANTPAEEQA